MAKSITLSGNNTINKMFRYDAGAGTYTDLSSGSGVDLFDDSFEVDDALYFTHTPAYYSFPFYYLEFDIGTAMSASSYTLVWEYYKSGVGWTAFKWLDDDTQSFSVTGTHYVAWRISNLMTYQTINSLERLWIRCRVTSVSTPSEGGATNATTVKFRYATINISGGTTGDPITMSDIVGTSGIVESGLVEQITNNATYIVYGTISQNASSYFLEKNSNIMMVAGYTNGGTFTFGESSGRAGQYGCNLYMTAIVNDQNIRWAATYYFYDTKLRGGTGNWVAYGSNITAYGLTLNNLIYGGGAVSFTDCNIASWSTYTAASNYSFTVDGGNFNYFEAYQDSPGFLVRNANISTAHARWDTKLVLYDSTYSTLTNWGSSGTYNPAYTYIHYSLDVQVFDEAGDAIQSATVSYQDVNGDPVQQWVGDLSTGSLDTLDDQTTDSSGVTGYQDILHYSKVATYTPSVVVTNTTYSPITVKVRKAGYLPQDFDITMDEKKVLTVILKRATMQIDQEGGIS